jgi:hypothetical protein
VRGIFASPPLDDFRQWAFLCAVAEDQRPLVGHFSMKVLPGPLCAVAVVLALATDPPFAQLSNLTATAILGWYAWYTATRTIPQLVENFRHELATERNQHRTDRDAFLYEMTEQRVQRHNDTTSIVLAVNELTSSIKYSGKSAAVSSHPDAPSSYPSKGMP